MSEGKKVFRVRQYELKTQSYLVEAENEGEAIKKVLDGKADAEDNGLEHHHVEEESGMPIHDIAEETLEIIKKEVGGLDYIPSIHSVKEVENPPIQRAPLFRRQHDTNRFKNDTDANSTEDQAAPRSED